MRVVTVIVVVGLVLGSASGSGAAPGLVVRGDARAWQEVLQAFSRLGSLRSYRIRANMGEGRRMLLEVVNPGRTRMVVGDGVLEVVRVGDEHRVRMAGGPWQCRPGVPVPQLPSGTPAPQHVEVTVERRPDAEVRGERARSYRYWFGAERDAVTQLYVSVRTGLPLRMQILGEAGQVKVTMDYGDFDAPIQIELPACQER